MFWYIDNVSCNAGLDVGGFSFPTLPSPSSELAFDRWAGLTGPDPARRPAPPPSGQYLLHFLTQFLGVETNHGLLT
jgi:hypothetical protein